MKVRLTMSNISALREGIKKGFCKSVNNNLDKNESDRVSDSEYMKDQTEAMVDQVENFLKKRISEEKEEHASERTFSGLECSMLRRKLTRKAEKEKIKSNIREIRKTEEEEF